MPIDRAQVQTSTAVGNGGDGYCHHGHLYAYWTESLLAGDRNDDTAMVLQNEN